MPFVPDSGQSVAESRDSPALAGTLTSARWLINLERITMLGLWNAKFKRSGVEYNQSGQQATLVGGAAATGAVVPVNPYALPRLALDVILGSHLTTGLGFSLDTRSGEWKAELGTASGSGDGESAWLAAVSPRFGYFRAITDNMAMWPRLGATFSKQHTKSPIAQTDTSLASVDLELAWLLRLFDYLALSTTLALGLPLGGVHESHFDSRLAELLKVPAHERFSVNFTSFSAHASLVGHL